MSSAWKKTTLPSNNRPANRFASQSTQQPQLVYMIWSAHTPQFGQLPSPLPRYSHTVTATTTAPGELFLFRGSEYGDASSDLYVISTRNFSTTLLQTSGELPTPRHGHGAALTSTTLLVCGGIGDQYDALDFNSLYLLNLGTSDLLMSGLTPIDHSFALQFRGSGPTLWSMVLDRALVATKPQLWPVPSCSSLAAISAGRSSMICGHSESIRTIVRFSCCCSEPFWPDIPAVKSQPSWELYEPTPGNEKPPSRSAHVSVATEDHIIMFVPLSFVPSPLVIILC